MSYTNFSTANRIGGLTRAPVRPFIVSAWVRPTSTANTGTIYCLTNLGTILHMYLLERNTTGYRVRVWAGGTAASAVVNSSVLLNTWQHVCYFERSATARHLYVDGVAGSNTTNRTPNAATDDHLIGCANDSSGPGWPWAGEIAEVMYAEVAASAVDAVGERDAIVASLRAAQPDDAVPGLIGTNAHYTPLLANLSVVMGGLSDWTATGSPMLSSENPAISGASAIAASAAQSLAGFTESASGRLLVKGSGAQPLAALGQTGSARLLLRGSSAQSVAAFGQTAAGDVEAAAGVNAEAAQAMAAFGQATEGRLRLSGVATATLGGFGQSAAARLPLLATASQGLDGVAQAGVGRVTIRSASAQAIGGFGQSTLGRLPINAVA